MFNPDIRYNCNNLLNNSIILINLCIYLQLIYIIKCGYFPSVLIKLKCNVFAILIITMLTFKKFNYLCIFFLILLYRHILICIVCIYVFSCDKSRTIPNALLCSSCAALCLNNYKHFF